MSTTSKVILAFAIGLILGSIALKIYLSSRQPAVEARRIYDITPENLMREDPEYFEKVIQNWKNSHLSAEAIERMTSSRISRNFARKLVKRWQTHNNSNRMLLAKPEAGHTGALAPVNSWWVDRGALEDVLETSIDGVRFYIARVDTSASLSPGYYHSLVFVGSNKSGGYNNNVLSATNEIYEYVEPCPNNCNRDTITELGY